jgi:hypothetical protein
MTEFVEQLDTKSNLFKAYVQAQKTEQEEARRKEYVSLVSSPPTFLVKLLLLFGT